MAGIRKYMMEKLGGTTAERMARAAEQGYALDYPLSHANESGVIEGGAFDLSRAGKNYPVSWGDAVYLGDRGLASNYGEQTGEYYLRNPEYVSARDALRKGYENDKTDQSFDEWMEGIEDSFGLYGWMEQGFEFNLDDAIKAGKDGVIVDFSGTPAKEKYVAFTKNPAAIRSINADFNPEYKDSSNLLAGVSSLAPYLGAGALAAGAMAPEDAEAAKMRIVDALVRRAGDEGILKTDYRGGHTAPVSPEYHAPLHDMTKTYPDDIYGKDAARFYGHGDPAMDRGSFDVINRVRGNENAPVTIYRAVPADASDEILPGDWVTPNLEYAKLHGEGLDDYKILRGETNAGRLRTDGNSPHEFGYTGNATPGALAGTAALTGAAMMPGAFGAMHGQDMLPALDTAAGVLADTGQLIYAGGKSLVDSLQGNDAREGFAGALSQRWLPPATEGRAALENAAGGALQAYADIKPPLFNPEGQSIGDMFSGVLSSAGDAYAGTVRPFMERNFGQYGANVAEGAGLAGAGVLGALGLPRAARGKPSVPINYQSGGIDPRLLKWLGLAGAGGYIASGMLEDDVKSSTAAQAFKPRVID